MTAPHDTQEATRAGAAAGSDTEEKPDIEELQANIEQTRQELGETVDALTAKLDVKSRARARVNDTKLRARDQLTEVQARAKDLTMQARSKATTDEGRPAPAVLAGAAGVLVSVLVATGLVMWRKRR